MCRGVCVGGECAVARQLHSNMYTKHDTNLAVYNVDKKSRVYVRTMHHAVLRIWQLAPVLAKKVCTTTHSDQYCV